MIVRGFKTRPVAAAQGRLIWAWHRKTDHRLGAPVECLVDVIASVGGQNLHTVKGFDMLKRKGHFLISVAIMRVFDLAVFARQRISLIKKQDPAFMFGLIKKPLLDFLLQLHPYVFNLSPRAGRQYQIVPVQRVLNALSGKVCAEDWGRLNSSVIFFLELLQTLDTFRTYDQSTDPDSLMRSALSAKML